MRSAREGDDRGERPVVLRAFGLGVPEIEFAHSLALIREGDPNGRSLPSAISSPDWSLARIGFFAISLLFVVVLHIGSSAPPWKDTSHVTVSRVIR
jgi:hypothetical protein